MMTDLAILTILAMLAAVTDLIIVRRRLAAMRRQYEEERAYCEDAESRATEMARKLDALSAAHWTLQAMYCNRTRMLLRLSNETVMTAVAWKRTTGEQ